MAVIYLRHPDHGCKVACVEAEADYDEKSGWARYNPEEVEEPPVNALKRKYTRKAETEEV